MIVFSPHILDYLLVLQGRKIDMTMSSLLQVVVLFQDLIQIINREYYMALSVSHPVSTRDTNIIPRA